MIQNIRAATDYYIVLTGQPYVTSYLTSRQFAIGRLCFLSLSLQVLKPRIAAAPTGACPKGQFNSTSGLYPCSLCPPGTYWANSTSCLMCPANTTTEGPGSFSISDCSVNATNPLFSFLKFPMMFLPDSNAGGLDAIFLRLSSLNRYLPSLTLFRT